NIKYEVSLGRNGLPCVTFKNLPPPASFDGPPPLPPKCPVPGLGSDSSGGTKESDIYCTPLVLFQIVDEIENLVNVSKKHIPSSPGTHEVIYSSLPSRKPASLSSAEPKIPVMIQENKPLLRIVMKCLSSQPSRRPTASELCAMLLRLCRSSVLSSALLDMGRSVLSGCKRLTPWL
ncbi:hypothetical protein B0H34DRAFT_702943, partial [Crassisporium funariophilum]